ncbi:hypothetical protein M409DRAFT_56208 [Zasmidium cellare ATCC 36951]|uniref:Fungal N-terminal domain-containing protein n=1 Tax=Zasmidium cellare ATCC 36951 TaxID=1080233 RepID=A0A6A6CHE2_ZASCE|nr:uncharacterized protein M409DRAFT_56208 [Zasmidium cellare ATCC 36951]KAF2164836.1 hypothetical protein M409DRAFT_56208 [Zasmidium cellare ATCC 36951]
MAELLGVIAGGAGMASLAIQLGESAVKARRLYHAARDAPETLQHVTFEIETFSLVLHEIARHGQSYDLEDSDTLVRCVRMCEQSVTRIRNAVNKLESLINRHSRLGKLRAAVDEKEISKACTDLERAKTTLGIALQLYSEYQRAKDRAIIRTRIDLSRNPQDESLTIVRPHQEDSVEEPDLDDRNAVERRRTRLNMFRDGLASPYDHSRLGHHSVLKDAMRLRNLELCRFIIQSLDIDAVDVCDIHHSLGNYAWISRFADNVEPDENRSVDMYRLLIECMDLTEETFLHGQWWEWIRNLQCMKLAQNALLRPYMDLAWQTRFEHAMELAISDLNLTAEMFLQPLACDFSDAQLARAKSGNGLTVLHAIATAAGSRTWAQLQAGSWVELARGYVTNGGFLLPQGMAGSTPLEHVLDGRGLIWHRIRCETTRLRTWVHMIKVIGIDLVLYGQEERAIWQANIHRRRTNPVREYDHRLVDEWSFGPNLEDWSLKFRNVSYVPIYEALAAPGIPGMWDAALGDLEERPATIPWTPLPEDDSALPFLSSWKRVRRIRLESNPFLAPEPKEEDMTESHYHSIAAKTQDDNSEIIRLLDASRHTISRPRSQSQPPLRDQRDASQTFDRIPHHSWLPAYHICVCDSKRRLAPCYTNDKDTWLAAFRRCMHGHHQRANFWKDIERRVRHFRRQYQTREELRRLPYDVYRCKDWQYGDWWEVTESIREG